MNRYRNVVLFIFFFTFFLLYTCISLWRLNIAQVFYYDAGIFARPLWELAHGLSPTIFHKSLGEIHFLGDHFIPSIAILIPLFWFSNPLPLLLIEQALALTISGFLLYLIAKKNNLLSWVSLSVSFVFLIFAGVVNTLVSDWHTEGTAAVFLLLFIYLFFYRQKYWIGFASAIIFLGWKESNAITFIFSLMPTFILFKKERSKTVMLAAFALVWFLFVTKIVIPYIIDKPYYYSPTLPTRFEEYFFQLFNSPQKRTLIVSSLLSFGFLPIISIPFLAATLGELAIRFIPTQSHFQSITLAMHYNIFLGVFLTLGTIHTLSLFNKKYIQKYIVIFLLLTSILVAKKITQSPIILATNKTFWGQWNVKSSLFNKLKCVPLSGSVMSQNNLLPHLIQRKEDIYLLTKDYKKLKPDFIVMDLSPGQNVNNFYSGEIHELSQVENLKKMIDADPIYIQDSSTCPDLLFFKKR